MAFSVRTITADQHVAYNAAQPAVTFLQTPAWGEVKREWERESIGWFDNRDQLVGAGLVLYRQLPRIKKYLAYLPEGPSIDWTADDIGAWLTPLACQTSEQPSSCSMSSTRNEIRVSSSTRRTFRPANCVCSDRTSLTQAPLTVAAGCG